ncbi:hypothetical protein OsI_02815 [Oryza sativa Indica Group]|uniref:Uncharacterized protein n=1 Tax=Oryza sativa subsp. indica TaxID=39946 RepID=B8ABL0_ORYSI|nr:hypothetical protein OsI_02815 [Oryza sativa Indica Group]
MSAVDEEQQWGRGGGISDGGGPWLTSTPIRLWTGSDWGDRSSLPLPGTDLGPCRAQPCRAPAAVGRGQLLLLLGARAALLLLLRSDEAVEVAVGLEADHEGAEAVLALHLALAEERDGLTEAAEARPHGEVVGRHGHGEGAATLEQLLHHALMALPRSTVVIGDLVLSLTAAPSSSRRGGRGDGDGGCRGGRRARGGETGMGAMGRGTGRGAMVGTAMVRLTAGAPCLHQRGGGAGLVPRSEWVDGRRLRRQVGQGRRRRVDPRRRQRAPRAIRPAPGANLAEVNNSERRRKRQGGGWKRDGSGISPILKNSSGMVINTRIIILFF